MQERDSIHNAESKLLQDSNPLKEIGNMESNPCYIDPKQNERDISNIESKHILDSKKDTLLNMQSGKILETSNCHIERSETSKNLETQKDISLNAQYDKILESKSTFHAPSKINPQFITTFKKSCIIISNDFESEKNYLSNTYAKEDIRIYDLEELKMDNAHEIIEEAHIATTRDKIIAIFAFSYNHYAQNALLKILEEPPSHIIFMLYITARNKLIPTIFSRLVVFNKSKKTRTKPLNLDLTRLTIPMVYEYVSKLEKEHISYEQGRNVLSQILDSMMTNNIMLDEKGLERFDLALKALYSKQSVHIALLPLLLSLVKG